MTAGGRRGWPMVVRDPRRSTQTRSSPTSRSPIWALTSYEGRYRVRIRQPGGSSAISTRRGDDYFPLPAAVWISRILLAPLPCAEERRLVGARFTLTTTIKRPDWLALRRSCHSVNYDIKTKSVTEWERWKVKPATDRAAPMSLIPV